MKIVNLKIDQIKPYEKNPRHNAEAVPHVARSIKEFGFQQPLVLDENHVVIVGHTRLLAAKSLGLKEVPCHIAKDLTPAQIRAYRIMDNKTHERSTWDKGLLLNELETAFQENNNFNLDFFDFETTFFDANFEPGSEDEQGQLDEKKKHTCPSCGHEF
jgi:site-specific DNA-methyltransferase (adenine-specific)